MTGNHLLRQHFLLSWCCLPYLEKNNFSNGSLIQLLCIHKWGLGTNLSHSYLPSYFDKWKWECGATILKVWISSMGPTNDLMQCLTPLWNPNIPNSFINGTPSPPPPPPGGLSPGIIIFLIWGGERQEEEEGPHQLQGAHIYVYDKFTHAIQQPSWVWACL